MAAATVRSNYDELKTSASSFSAQADAVSSATQAIRSAMDTLQGGDWIGEGARKFYAEMNSDILPTLKRLQAALANASRVTNQISQTMKQAEEQSAGIFHV